MRIAIIGTGRVGSALARGLSRQGHAIWLGARDPARASGLASETGATAVTPPEAARAAELVFLALPWSAAETVLRGLGDLAGKVVIDCMNPIGPVPGGIGLTVGNSTSGAEMVQAWLPEARVVKTLHQVGAEIMASNAGLPHRPVQFVAGDDAEAKAAVIGLLTDLGFDPLDAGDLTKARLLEPFALLWIHQSMLRGKGRNWAFAAVSAADQ